MARILLVDDDDTLRTTVGLVLESQGHEVVSIGDGLQALDVLHGIDPFDLMIADLRMAPVDGLEVIEAARKERPEMAVIVMSAYISDDMFNKTLEMGVKGFVDKPFSLEDLLVPVREVLLNK